MLRKIIGYVPSTVFPAVISVVMLYIYTRVLTTTEFGDFSFTFAGVLFVQNSVFVAIAVAVMQFYPEAEADGRKTTFMAECLLLLISVSSILAICAWAASCLSIGQLPIGQSNELILLGAALTVSRSAVSVTQAVRRAEERAWSYNLVECLHAAFGLAFGLVLVHLRGPSAESVVMGLLGAAVLCLMPGLPGLVHAACAIRHVEVKGIMRLLSFTSPLVGVDILVSLLQLSDRFLLGALGGSEALGIYSVSYNLVDRPTTLLCTAITTATYPMAVQALQHGRVAGKLQMGRNGAALLALAIPACVGLWLIKGSFVQIMVGPDFRAGAESLIPIMCLSALARGFSTHFIDHAFQLARRPSKALWVYGPTAAATIVLNGILIPFFGARGAAWAGLICQSFALVAGWMVARGIFPIWIPPGDVIKILLAVLPMAVVLTEVHFAISLSGLVSAIVTGGAVFGLGAIILDVVGLRSGAAEFIGGMARKRMSLR
jgi:O-antigen/teichoic acid export membrane protein